LTRLLPPNRRAEFDFRSLVSPDPETELTLILAEIAGGLLTVDEGRRLINMPPLPKAGEQKGDSPEEV
jgi:hypothetical protein